jgi:hypothetical protein
LNTDLIIQAPLPGECTLRAAIMEANASVGAVEILFDAALLNGTILPQSALPTIAHDETTIDALKDPDTGGQRALTQAFLTVSGANAGAVDGFTIQADNCTIRGLAINEFNANGIRITNGTQNRIESNMIGIDAMGNAAIGNGGDGITVENSTTMMPPNNEITGNVISGNSRHGVNLVATTNHNQIKGNKIGTNAAGTQARGNGDSGIFVNGDNSTIGGSTVADRNLISGNGDYGIDISVSAGGTTVQGNYIGTDVNGTAGVSGGTNNNLGGINLNQTDTNTIGGLPVAMAGQPPGNTIAFNRNVGVNIAGSGSTNNQVLGNKIHNNQSDGVRVSVSATANRISQNVIFCNGSTTPNQCGLIGDLNLGIDLVGTNGVNLNDPAPDMDTGPNNLQNFPEISSATISGGTTRIQGTLRSTPNTTFTLEFFTNSVQDSTNPCCYGEGEHFLTSITRTTDSNGNVNFDFTTNAPIPAGHQFMSATATHDLGNNLGNTSEFAQNVPISGSGTIPPFITVLVPDGGEDWAIGSVQPIQWDPDGVTGNVKIELSRDGGSTFETLFASTANDGSENWTVTGPTSSNCLVKISSVDDPSINDLSDAAFTISQSPSGPSITVLVPNGGESWPIGSVQTIQWTSSGITSNVNIELSRDGGFRYTTIIARNAANTGSYQWTVTGPASSQCKIRVISLNPVVLDESDDVFSITP